MSSKFSVLPQVLLDAMQSAIVIKNSHGVILAHNRAFQDLNPNVPQLLGLTAHNYLPAMQANLFASVDLELLHCPTGYLEHYFEHFTKGASSTLFKAHKSLSHADNGAEIIVVINTAKQEFNQKPQYALSPRELTVLELLVCGNTQKQIAVALGISHHTVADHMKAIFIKMGVNNRTQAQLKAMTELGIRVK